MIAGIFQCQMTYSKANILVLLESLLLLKKHPVVGVNILSNHRGFADILPLVRYHREAFDGSGYADGKKGEDIPLGARVLHLFDMLDELTSGWNGQEILTKEEALAAIHEKAKNN